MFVRCTKPEPDGYRLVHPLFAKMYICNGFIQENLLEEKYKITKILVKSDLQELQVQWADGHGSRFPLDALRKVCPCVFCQGGHEAMGAPVDPGVFAEAPTRKRTISKIRMVGNYALQVVWGDGHNTGIYRLEKLRNMCPVEHGIL